MDLITIHVPDLDAGGTVLDEILPADWLVAQLADCEADVTGPGKAHLRVSLSGKPNVVVRGWVEAPVQLTCARCLAPVVLTLRGEVSLLLKPRAAGKPPTADEREFSSSEAEEDEYDGEKIALDGFLREALALELPPTALCREDCPGIRDIPKNLTEKPIDPRLAPLLNIVPKDAKKGR